MTDERIERLRAPMFKVFGVAVPVVFPFRIWTGRLEAWLFGARERDVWEVVFDRALDWLWTYTLLKFALLILLMAVGGALHLLGLA